VWALECVEVLHVLTLGPRLHTSYGPDHGAGQTVQRLSTLHALNELRERGVAFTQRRTIDLGVVLEHLACERGCVWAADDDGGFRVQPPDEPGDERDTSAIGGPARHAEHVGIEGGDHLLHALPRERGKVQYLYPVPVADCLRPECEQPVRCLIEIRVEVALPEIGGRTVTRGVGGRAGHGDFPRRRVKKGDSRGAHAVEPSRA
jgi:hypothetical protein